MKQIRSMSLEELVKARADIEVAIELLAVRDRQTLIGVLAAVRHFALTLIP